MRAYLMFKDKNFKVDNTGMYNFDVTLSDIEIETILRSIADKDLLMVNVLRTALANPLYDIDEIKYRRSFIFNTATTRATSIMLTAIILAPHYFSLDKTV